MPEACFLCIDSSSFMRNGDFFPTRMMATQEAANLLFGAKIQRNPENTIGFLTMGGKSCTVMETLTQDLDRVMASVTKVSIGGTLHFAHGLQIGSLALSHRLNPRAEKRIVAFVGSPIQEDEKTLEKLAKKLRKDEVAVDIVGFGCEANVPLLQKFIETVNKGNNSHLLFVPTGQQIGDVMLSSVIVYGEEAVAQMGAAGAAGAGAGGFGGPGAGGFEFGFDPNTDPELAMVLRMSLEEERRRQELAAGGGATTAPSGEAATTAAAAAPRPGDGERVLTEEEELELALKMSLQDGAGEDASEQPANVEGGAPAGSSTGASGATTASAGGAPRVDPAFDAALQDPDFLKELQDTLEKDKQGGGGSGGGPDKK